MIKLTFKHLLVVSMILTLFLGLSLVSATDVTDDSAVSTKNICTHSITSDNDNVDVNDINNYAKNTVISTSKNNSNNDENIIKGNNNGNTVGSSNEGTISELNTTINTGSSSSITLDKDYTYNNGTDSGFTNGIVVNRDLIIDGQGHTIDLGGKIMFLQIDIGYNLILKNLIIKNGRDSAVSIYCGNGSFINSTFTGNSAISRGGAVYIYEGNGSFINSTFTNNNGKNEYDEFTYGGAVYIYKGNGSFINSTFTGNNASQGGAVYIYKGNGSFINSTFTGNNASQGGAVYINHGNGSFINSTFTGNNASQGGAVYINSSNGSFINSTFTGNNASQGGAVQISYGNGSFINSTFTGNNASQGGAVQISYGNGSFINSTFTGNSAISRGGAVYINEGNGSFINSTFTGNSAISRGGAVYINEGNGSFINSTFNNNKLEIEDFSSTYGGAVYINEGNGSFINSTFTGNRASSRGGAVYIYEGNGSFINSTFNNNKLENIYFGSTYGGAVYISSGSGSFINSTFTGNTAVFNGAGGAVYISSGSGSFINSTFTGNTATYDGVVYISRGNSTFVNCTFTGNKVYNEAGAVYISSGSGSFIDSTFTNGYAPDRRAVYVTNGNGTFINTNFNGYTAVYGGAVFISSGSGSFVNCTFTGNNASQGGAVFITSGSGSFVNCTFTGNNASQGGAVFITSGSGSFVNCTFTGNNADAGGAVFINHSDNTSFVNSIFTGNNATSDGGAVWISGNGSFINSTFTGNKGKNPHSEGGAVYFSNGNGNFINSTFTANNIENSYSEGGAVYISNGNGNFINSTFIDNNVKGENSMGGAVYIESDYGNFVNCTFTSNYASIDGGAVYIFSSGSFVNCTFTSNYASIDGGAVYIFSSGSFVNCTFTGNHAEYYTGAISCTDGTAILCRFNTVNDTISDNVDIIPASINALNYTSTYQSGEKLEFNLTVYDMVFDGFNTTIDIFKDGIFVNTFYGLTGEGWIVDLNPGVYTAVLSLTSYPAEKSSNATIIIKEDTTVVIDPIINPEIGKEITIKYNTNSNATATIKINGTTIHDCKFIPTQAGTYNITVYVAENEYYTAGYNTTTFNVIKINTTVTINPISDVEIGKEITIKYNTNSNATATIKINGTTIPDCKFIPTQAGTYNITVDVAENEYYTAGYNTTTFNVIKINTTVTINPISDVEIGKEITIKYNTNSNATATIKINGTTIPNNKFTPNKNGTYNVTVDVVENEYYTAGSAETNFTVGKLASSIIADSVSTTYTVDKFLVISLKDSNGNPISGADLSVNLRGIKNYTTNENGQVLINVAKLYPKTYNVKITYAGSDNFNGSTGSAKVTVNKITSSIIAKSPTFKLNQNIKKYTITLKYLGNKLIANKKVVLNFNGKTYTVKTNNKGQGVFKIYKHLKKGVYNAVITVPKNSYYNKVIKKVKITVK